jgi:hypothetical protein
MDQEEPNIQPDHSLLPAFGRTATLPVLSAANPLTSTDQVLTSLGFNPSTKNRYTTLAARRLFGRRTAPSRSSPTEL